MSDRLTVVFDDSTLYRRLKVRAAQDGIAVKKLIEAAVEAYLSSGAAARKPFDFEAFGRWQAEMDAIDRAKPPSPDELEDLSDIKHHLYGYPKRPAPGRIAHAAEAPAEYDAQ